MPIVVIGSSKGGSGKSTLTTNLISMHLNQGGQSAMLDADPQRSAANWAALRASNEVHPEVVVFEKGGGDTNRDAGAEVKRTALEIAKHYETVFIDVPGNNSPGLRASVLVADLLIYPIRPSNFDAWVLHQDFTEVIENARIINPTLRVMVIMNGLSPSPGARARETANLRSYLSDYAGYYLSPHYLCSRSQFIAAVQEGRGVTELTGSSASLEKAQLEITAVYRDALRCLNGERAEAYAEGAFE